MRPQAAEWAVTWSEATERDSPGELLGTETKSPNFNFNAGWLWNDKVFADRREYMRMDATMTVVAQLTGAVRFYFRVDDDFRLYLDDDPDPIMDSSNNTGGVEEWVFIQKGVHQLRLEYWNGPATAILFFRMDEHLLSWDEASDCEGFRNDLPDQLHFTYRAQTESLLDIAERFQLQLSELQFANPGINNPYAIYTGKLFLVPGNRSPENRKIVLLQGIGSSSDSDLYAHRADFGGRRSEVLQFVQKYGISEASSNQGNLYFDEPDVIGFSYADRYFDVQKARWVSGSQYEPGHLLIAKYESADTCSGVHTASQNLDLLLRRIAATEPDVKIDIIAHSFGGLVAAYWVAAQDSDFLNRHIRSLITLDSPLNGTANINLIIYCTEGPYLSTRDLTIGSDVVRQIGRVEATTHRVPIFHINSSWIGDTLPRGNDLGSPCGGGLAFLWSALAMLFNPWLILVAGPLGSAAEHSCVWTDSRSHDLMTQEVIFADVYNASSYYNKGEEYYNAGNWAMAIEEFTNAIQANPNYSNAYWYRGLAYSYLGEYQTAIADYTKTIQLGPDDARFYNNRGLAYFYLGEYQTAIADYTKAIQLDPDYARFYNNRAWAYYYLGQYSNQEADETKACSLDSKYC